MHARQKEAGAICCAHRAHGLTEEHRLERQHASNREEHLHSQRSARLGTNHPPRFHAIFPETCTPGNSRLPERPLLLVSQKVKMLDKKRRDVHVSIDWEPLLHVQSCHYVSLEMSSMTSLLSE